MAVDYASFVKLFNNFGGGSGNVSATVPTGLTAGDLWVIWGSDDNNGSDGNISVPTGFTAFNTGSRCGDGFPFSRGFWKVAGASESAVTVAFGSGTYGCTVYSVRITGADTTSPIGNIAVTLTNATASTTIDAPDVTITSNGSLALLHTAAYRNASVTTAAAPTGATLISTENTSGFQHSGIAYQQVNAGSFAPGNWTYSGSSANRTATTVEIKPAATGSTVSGDGSASGTGAATGTGQALATATGSSDGVGAVTATGRSLVVTVGTSTGSGTASGVGSSSSTAASDGSSSGTGAATATGQALARTVASSAGTSTVTGTGRSLGVTTGSSAGTSTASGTTKTLFTGTGLSSGSGQAQAVPEGVEAVTTTPYPSHRRRRHG